MNCNAKSNLWPGNYYWMWILILGLVPYWIVFMFVSFFKCLYFLNFFMLVWYKNKQEEFEELFFIFLEEHDYLCFLRMVFNIYSSAGYMLLYMYIKFLFHCRLHLVLYVHLPCLMRISTTETYWRQQKRYLSNLFQ